MKRVLIAFGTRYGATEGTSEEIATVLRDSGLDVTVVNLKNEKIDDIDPFDAVIVGSGMQMGRWTGSAEKFLKKFSSKLADKQLAIFVSSGALKPEEFEQNRKAYLGDRAVKYSLSPVSMGMFGGVWDYNKMFFLFRKTLSSLKTQIEEAGYSETEPGRYDTRDWQVIRDWAKELAEKL